MGCCFGNDRSKRSSLENDEFDMASRCSMKYQAEGVDYEEFATVGAGCYWGTEKYYVKDFQKKHPGALLGYAVGFMSAEPDAPVRPSYREVCSGTTGHVEVFHMRFDNRKCTYEDICKHLFTFHDPTTLNK